MTAEEHQKVHYVTIRGGTGDLTGATIHVVRPAAGLEAVFVVTERVPESDGATVYTMILDKQGV